MDPLPAIPWYRSPVFIGAVVSIVSQLLVLTGLTDKVSPEDVAKYVDAVFQVIALAAAVFAAVQRQRSTIQPLTMTQAGADKAGQAKSHPLVVVLLVAAAFSMLTGCARFAVQEANTPEQKAAALLGDFTVYQSASLSIASDATIVPEVRRAVADAAIAAKPIADQLDAALRQYRSIAATVQAGSTSDERVRIAAANLNRWILELTPLVRSLRSTVERASR